MKKKLLTLALALCLVLSLAGTAYADLIWEPGDDSFFQIHKKDFRLSMTDYYANSPKGSVQAYDRPDGAVKAILKNGECFEAYYIYTDESGHEWGVDYGDNGEGLLYIPIKDLLNCYDYEFFFDHAEECTTTCPADIILPVGAIDGLLLWNYPRGLCETFEPYSYWEDDMNLVDLCTDFYTDPEGERWGFAKIDGHCSAWICLTDPSDPDLAQPEIFTGRVYGADGGIGNYLPENPWYIILPVCAVALTVILLLWPKRKKRSKCF